MFDLEDENRLITSTMKIEDSETEVSLRPKVLSDYLGQEKVKEQLGIFIEGMMIFREYTLFLRQCIYLTE